MHACLKTSGPTRRLLMAAVGSALIGPARADALHDGRFRDEVAAILRAIRPGSDILPDGDPGQLKVGRFTIALTNLYPRVAVLTGEERRSAIERYILSSLKDVASATSLQVPDLASVQSRLRVQLLPRDFLRVVPELATRVFSETLIVAYVIDQPDRIFYVTRPMLQQWGVEAGAIQKAIEGPALANLAAASKKSAFGLMLADGAPVLAMADTGDDYDAARMMLPDYLDDIRTALKADSITVAGPTRGLLMAWPSDGKARVDLAAEVRRHMQAGPYGRSDELFRFDRTGLRPLTATERADHGR